VLAVEVDLHPVAPSNPLDDASGLQILYDAWRADLPDPDNFLRHSSLLGILRKAGWQDPELGASLERAAHTADRAVRMASYRQADRRLVAEQALVVPLTYGGFNELSRPWVRDRRPTKLARPSLKDVVVGKHGSA
jgi:ABC-type oligopeptide transport system substrate-binding subunit